MDFTLKVFLIACSFNLILSSLDHGTIYISKLNGISEKCNQSIFGDIDGCTQKSMEIWNSTAIIQGATAVKSQCCHAYDIADCTIDLVKNDQDKCTPKEYQDVKNLNQQEVKHWESTYQCDKHKYYSTGCAISAEDIKNDTSDADKEKLMKKTMIRVPSDTCQDVTKNNKCDEKVALESGYHQEDLKNNITVNKIDCCLNYKIIDCMLDIAKASDKCSHPDINGLIRNYDSIKANITKNECKDYPEGSEQCKNSSYKLANTLVVYFAIIFVVKYFVNL